MGAEQDPPRPNFDATRRPGRWWRVVAPDGSLWCETSDEAEARAAVRPGDTLWREWWEVTRGHERPPMAD